MIVSSTGRALLALALLCVLGVVLNLSMTVMEPKLDEEVLKVNEAAWLNRFQLTVPEPSVKPRETGSGTNVKAPIVLVLGIGHQLCEAVAGSFTANRENLRQVIREDEISASKYTLEAVHTIAKYLGSQAQTILPRPADLPQEVAESATVAITRLLDELASSQMTVVAVIPHLVFLWPIVEQQLRLRKLEHVHPIIVVEDGLASSLRDNSHFIDAVGHAMVNERILDTLCLMRVRPFDIEGGTASNLRSAVMQDRIRLAPTVNHNNVEKSPCQVTELASMRNAIIWSKLMRSLALLSLDSMNQIPLLRIPTENVCGFLKENIVLISSGTSSPLKSPSSMINEDQRKKNDRKRRKRADRSPEEGEAKSVCEFLGQDVDESKTLSKAFLQDLDLLLDPEVMSSFKFETPVSSRGVLPNPVLENLSNDRIDAGYCVEQANLKKLSMEKRTSLVFPVAHCLPSFLLIGAQKAGTDELAVWLNQLFYARRLDGGVEIHFFDCLGRGKGWNRSPCSRARRPKMLYDSHAGMENLTIARENGQKLAFAWNDLRKESNYVSSWWEKYLELGNMFYTGYKRHAMTFEKTPAYMDLGHPMDMMRMMPSAKLIFMLRDPVQRFISSYFQMCSGMYQTVHNCTYPDMQQRFETLSADFDPTATDRFDQNSVDFFVHRGIAHSLYSYWLMKWRAAFPDQQIMIVFSEHFRVFPQGVIFAIESFLGLTESRQHHQFHPIKTNKGYYVLGGYSKANNPSHKEAPPADLLQQLQAFFNPYSVQLRNLIENSDIVYKPQQQVPGKYNSDFSFPEWLVPASSTL